MINGNSLIFIREEIVEICKSMLRGIFTLVMFVTLISSCTTSPKSITNEIVSTENTQETVPQQILDCSQYKARLLSLKSDEQLKAIKEYQSMLQANCDTNQNRLDFGLTLASNRQWEEAATQYRIIINRDPKNWYAHWTLAQTLILELNQYEEGLREVHISRQLDDLGDIGFTYDYYLGKAFEGLGKYDEALKHYEIYIKSQAKVWEGHKHYADANERVKHIREKLKNAG